MKMQTKFEREIEQRQTTRLRNEDRFLGRIEKLELAAERMVGELVRGGKTVRYIWPEGGKYREGTLPKLVGFLIRNQYV
jgi:hypothetical protein